MKNNFYLFSFIFLLLANNVLVAQKVMDKGTVKMEITNVSAEDPQMAMGLEMMKGSETELIFKEDQYVTNMNMMGGMMKIQVHVEKSKNTMNMLMDMMGNKSWIESKLDEAQNAQQKAINFAENMD